MADDATTEDTSEDTQEPQAQPDGLTVVAEDPDGSTEAVEAQPADDVDGAEPESRTILENTEERAEYMPLFVAPQPVAFEPEPDDDDDDDDDSDDGPDSDEDQAAPPNKRRRRGRRGRGRGRGEQNGDDSGDDSDDGQAEDSDETMTASTTPTTTAVTTKAVARTPAIAAVAAVAAASPALGTTTTARPTIRPTPWSTNVPGARTKDKDKDKDNGEIQGISGSTRLEAKRQRRRDGRDAGRRRPPILSEAEFLARREAVERVMVVRDKVRTEPPHEGARYTQIAVLEDGVVVEHFVTSAASASLVGNIYLGIVQNVLPSMEAAFVDIGRGRNGVLYAGEVNWEAAGLGGAARKIEQALKPGDYVVVQVSKDPVGHKGARLTTQVSLAGRYLVYVPGASSTGISRKLPDTERQRLKEILREVVPSDAGVIIRTASEGRQGRRHPHRRDPAAGTLVADRFEGGRDQEEGGRRGDRALRRARRAGQGHPRPVQRGLLRPDRVRRRGLGHHQ